MRCSLHVASAFCSKEGGAQGMAVNPVPHSALLSGHEETAEI